MINEDESDLHNYEHYLSISENKAWKKKLIGGFSSLLQRSLSCSC